MCEKRDKKQKNRLYFAFTLAEVLITLGVIGIVAALTIPLIIQNSQDTQFKTAYKAAYKDFSQVFSQSISDNSLIPSSTTAATTLEWSLITSSFRITKQCTPAQLNECWATGDTVCTAPCGTGYPDISASSASFIDSSGRSWAEFNSSGSMYLVDTNGLKPPNRFGKDRWVFVLRNADNTRAIGTIPVKVGPLNAPDMTTAYEWCHYPPCYFQSWLFE